MYILSYLSGRQVPEMTMISEMLKTRKYLDTIVIGAIENPKGES